MLAVLATPLGVLDLTRETLTLTPDARPLQRYGATATGLSAPNDTDHIALCDALRARDSIRVQAELGAIRGLPTQHNILFDSIFCAHGFYDDGAIAQYGFSYPSQVGLPLLCSSSLARLLLFSSPPPLLSSHLLLAARRLPRTAPRHHAAQARVRDRL